MVQRNWTIEYAPDFKREWKKLDSFLQRRIIDFFSERLGTSEDPKIYAKPLTGNLKNFWRYRIGDYRLICEIKEKEKTILLIHVAHRREVYKNIHFSKSSA